MNCQKKEYHLLLEKEIYICSKKARLLRQKSSIPHLITSRTEVAGPPVCPEQARWRLSEREEREERPRGPSQQEAGRKSLCMLVTGSHVLCMPSGMATGKPPQLRHATRGSRSRMSHEASGLQRGEWALGLWLCREGQRMSTGADAEGLQFAAAGRVPGSKRQRHKNQQHDAGQADQAHPQPSEAHQQCRGRTGQGAAVTPQQGCKAQGKTPLAPAPMPTQRPEGKGAQVLRTGIGVVQRESGRLLQLLPRSLRLLCHQRSTEGVGLSRNHTSSHRMCLVDCSFG